MTSAYYCQEKSSNHYGERSIRCGHIALTVKSEETDDTPRNIVNCEIKQGNPDKVTGQQQANNYQETEVNLSGG